MKKIDSILKGKIDVKLIETKKAKINATIEVALLNAKDELLGKELSYAKLMEKLGTTTSYENVIKEMVELKQDVQDIESCIEALQAIKKDLEQEVEVEQDEDK